MIELWHTDRKQWDVEKVKNLVADELVDFVLSVPLFESITNDTLMWWPSEDGNYTVKSGYRLYMEDLMILLIYL